MEQKQEEKVAVTNSVVNYYVGVMLDVQDQVVLLDMFPPPVGWVPCATHMTLSFLPLTTSSPVRLGQRVTLTVEKMGKNEHAQAVQVKVRGISGV